MIGQPRPRGPTVLPAPRPGGHEESKGAPPLRELRQELRRA
jgi:hypothetical protein